MRLTDILRSDCVRVPLEAVAKRAAIDELAELLASKTPLADVEGLKEAIWQRETTRTTGIGHGIAIPHGKTAGVDRLRLAIGKPVEPLAFDAVDGQPVDLILLLVSPADQTGPHIQALAKISRLLTDGTFRGRLREAGTGEELYRMIEGQEAKVGV